MFRWQLEERSMLDGVPPNAASAVSLNLQFVQKAFIVHGGRLLLVRRAASDPLHPHRWEVPGGRLELGEDLDAHIRREVWEEAGVCVEPGRPFQMWQWEMPDTRTADPDARIQVVAVARLCRAVSYTLSDQHRVPDDHLAEAIWASLDELDRFEIIPDLKPAMEDFRRDLDRAP